MDELLPDFPGTDRYQVLRRIGAGGMGVVYEAEDRERGQRVALKTLAAPDVDKIYKLKREFRALADLSHPNLAALYDLVVADKTCFFTMELLEGADFLTYVTPEFPLAGIKTHDSVAFAPTVTTTDSDLSTLVSSQMPASKHADLTQAGTLDRIACDEKRLRAVLPQLAKGLVALHDAGKVHRDIKPSNILIAPDGRVVLLDFGLVTETDEKRRRDDASHLIVGTIGYMAPEQAASEGKISPAADWYAVGVLMYQALTGRLPFTGTAVRVLLDKQMRTPAPVRAIVPSVPRDLDELCAELLSRDPRERPEGWDVLRRLGAAVDRRGRTRTRTSSSGEAVFAGRVRELAALEDALAQVSGGKAAVAVVSGASGIGKSALVSKFLERARAQDEHTVILAGRCYERETVPYKAVDSLIDDLSNHWISLSPTAAKELLPREASILPTLFPVLARVAAVTDAPQVKVPLDPQELRTHAFSALRQVLQRLADRHPLVLFLDDLQWVDADTMALLADLMRAPDPPSLLLLLATRVEGRDAVLAEAERMHARCARVDVGPLAPEEALELLTRELGEGTAELAEKMAAEAAGSPFFLLELTRYMEGRALTELGGKGLDEVLGERLATLGEQARTVVELVAVAGEPLPRKVLTTASGLPSEDVSRHFTFLRAQRFVRVATGRADDMLEPYHDRIRETLLALMPEARRARHHRALATALVGRGTSEQLARHWHAAGEPARAAEHARRAADEARTKLDFHRAAELYRMVLEADSRDAADVRHLRTNLATALVDAGRSLEASREFSAAADGADATTALELRRRAADALLHAGYMDEGIAATERVLAEVGMKLPATPGRALASVITRRAWLRLRGLGYTPRALGEITQEELTRVDVCEGVAFGLAMVDTFKSADFGTRFLAAALALGERWRISRALALEADFLAVQAKRARAEALMVKLTELTEEIGTTAARAQLRSTQGLVQFLCYNRWRPAYELLSEATVLHRAGVGRAGFEVDTVGLFMCWSLQFLGELGELSRRVPALVEAAQRDGDRYAAVTYRCAFPYAWLGRQPADDIERDILDALKSWAPATNVYQMQHLFTLCARLELAMFRGEPEAATPLLAADEKPLARSLLAKPPTNRTHFLETIGRHALACAAAAAPGSARRKQAIGEARRHARGLAGLPQPIAPAAAAVLRAGAASLLGDRDGAVRELRTAEAGFAALETNLFAQAIRWRLGQELGGDAGAALIESSRRFYADEGVAEPHRMVALLVPGWS